MEATSIADQADEVRTHLRGMWAKVAPAWGDHADYVDNRAAELSARMLDATDLQAGQHVLELACGAGGLGLAAAERVAPGGEVVLSDVADEMVSIAAARAGERGIDNVSARRLDVERIDEPDASFDVVLCREGLMFAVDHAQAAREIRRVLRPRGRVAIATWAPREENPWLGVLFDAVTAQLGVPVPPPGIPGPFSLSDADGLATLLTGAGLTGVAVERVSCPMRTGSFDEWWNRTSALAGPLAAILANLPAEARDALVARLREAMKPYATDSGGLELPAVSLLATGRVA